MVTCQSSELDWEVTVELPADFLSLGRGSVTGGPPKVRIGGVSGRGRGPIIKGPGVGPSQ